MSSSIDTIRKVTKLENAEYVIPSVYKDHREKPVRRGDYSFIPLQEKDLELYDVFPITNIVRRSDGRYIEYVLPNVVEGTAPDKINTKIRSEQKKAVPLDNIKDESNMFLKGKHILFICCNSDDILEKPSPNNDFWCRSIDIAYVDYVTDAQPSKGEQYIWYYGKRKIQIGGRPRRRSTFRHRRLKRTTSKSRRRATRTSRAPPPRV
jgi:hypothetical protein